MAYTTAQRDALRSAIASGELSVSYEGKTVTYRSIPELKEALAVVEAALEAQGTVTKQTNVSYAAYSRG